MPGGDGTGPMGAGPMTGRAMGFCAGYGMPGWAHGGWGRGRGWWRGGGRGRRNLYWATGLTGWQRAAMGWPGPYGVAPVAMTDAQEVEMLRRQKEQMETALTDMERRIAELEGKADQ